MKIEGKARGPYTVGNDRDEKCLKKEKEILTNDCVYELKSGSLGLFGRKI